MKSVAIEHMWKDNDTKLSVEWNISKRCNFDCSYCSHYTHDAVSKWQSLETYKKVVDKLVKSTNKNIWLAFTGGEPTLFPQFEELLCYCKEQGIFHLSLSTNSSLSSKKYIKLWEYLNHSQMTIHLEYSTSFALNSILAVHNYIEGKDNKDMHVHIMMLPGHFPKIINILNILDTNNIIYALRRIRPLYMSDGKVTRPYQRGGKLKLTENGPDYSDDQDYYTEEEILFIQGK